MHHMMAVAFAMQSASVQTPRPAKKFKMRPSRVILLLDRTTFPHQFCHSHRLLSVVDFASVLRIFRRRKRCLWHHNATPTGHPIQQSTTYFTRVGGKVMVFVWGCSNHHEFSYLSHDIVFYNQPEILTSNLQDN